MFSIGDIFKKAVTGAATWAGNAIGGPTGAKIGAALAGSLMNKGGVGADYEIQNTSQAPVSYSGKVGFERADEAGSVRGGAKTADGKDLAMYWDRKLMTAMGKDAEYKRTLT
tara:strand:+ start:202 stop:537 length:336 start_codon:yes stop_codon:yes gene_type:complete